MSALLCFFCGGKDCKYENWRVWSDVAIEGLYSSWITDTILATARPSTRLMKAHSIVKSFQQKNITAVFCLQEPGEHASCGDGVQSNGWSYNVEDFMDAGIHWYWFGWRDMDVPDVKHMLRLVQVMASVIEIGGGIAVHCHAGLGRTGLAIACYLVYDGWHADKAIQLIRTRRPLSIQTRRQTLFVYSFTESLRPLRVVFPGVCDESPTQYPGVFMEGHDLQGILERQRVWLRGGDGRWGRWLPKVVKLICDKLVNENCDTVAAYVAEYEGLEKVSDELVEIMADFNTSLTPNLDLPPRTLVALLLYWITSLKTPLATSTFTSQLSTASIAELDKGILYTLNVLINPLRGSSDRAVFEHLARFLTRARTNLKHPFVPQLLYTNKVKALVQKVGKAPISTPTTSNFPGGGSGNAVDAESEKSEMNVLANFLFDLARDYICNEYGKPVAASPQAAVKTIPDEDEDLVVESLKRASDVSRRMISVSLTSLEQQPLPGTDESSRPQLDGALGYDTQMTEVPYA